MRRWIVLAVAATGLLWTGLWFAGRAALRSEIDAQISELRAGGGEAAFESLAIGGFPFGYSAQIEKPDIAMPSVIEGRAGRLRWHAPGLEASSNVAAPGRVELALPPRQSLQFTTAGVEAASAIVDSKQLLLRIDPRADTLSAQAAFLDIALDLLRLGDGIASEIDIEGRGFDVDAVREGDRLSFEFDADRLLVFATREAATTQASPWHAELSGAKIAATGRLSESRIACEAQVTAPQITLGGTAGFGLRAKDAEFRADLPLQPDGSEEAFAYAASFRDAELDERFWRLIDPRNRLDRKIDTLHFDLDGTLAPRPAGAAFGVESFRTLALNAFHAVAVGAELSAQGEGALIEGALSGRVEMQVLGIDALIETLVRNGILPPQQAIMARLMLQNFARPGTREGEKLFVLEWKDDLFFVNGTPMGPAPRLR